MLDDENFEDDFDVDAMAEIEAEFDADEPKSTPEAEVEADDEPELTITLDGEEPEADPYAELEAELGESGKRALPQIRKALKDAQARAKMAEAELIRRDAAQAPKVEELKRPTLADCDYNDDVFFERTEAYVKAQDAVKAKQAEADAAAKADDEDYKDRHSKYVTAKATMRVADFDAAESGVLAALSKAQQSVLIRNAKDSAALIYALGTNPKALAELAKVTEIDRFAFQLAQTQGKMIVTQKAPPPPESKLRGGTATAVASKSLDKLHEKAVSDRDYTALFAELKRLNGTS